MQPRLFGYSILDKNRATSWIKNRGKPTHHCPKNKVFNSPKVFIPFGKREQICNEEKAVVIVMQSNPVLNYHLQMIKIQHSCGAHTCHDASLRFNITQ